MYRIEKETEFNGDVYIKAFANDDILCTKLVTETQPIEWCIDTAKTSISLHKEMGKKSNIEIIHTEN